MGIAAYNRGTKVIERQIDAQLRDPYFLLMDDLNALPKYPKAATPFGPINFSEGHGGWWAMCPVTGFGFWYETLREAVRNWNVQVTEFNGKAWVGIPNG